MILETILGMATGIIGNVVGGIFKYKAQKLELDIKKAGNEHELKMVEAETAAMIQESKASIAITRATVEGEIELTDAQAFIQGQKEGNKALFNNKWIEKLFSVTGRWKIITLPLASLIATLFGLSDFVRGMLRPALTVYLCGVTTWITMLAWRIMQQNGISLTSVQAVGIFTEITGVVTYLTISSVTFWFADRSMNKFLTQLNGGNVTKIDDEIKI